MAGEWDAFPAVASGGEWNAFPEVDRPSLLARIGRTADDFVRGVAGGVTSNLMDEIAAGGDAAIGHFVGRGSQAPTFGERYDQNLAAERARDEAAPTAVRLPGEIAGGVAQATVAAPVRLLQAPTYIGRLARLAGLGAAQGGAAGFGAGEGGAENRLLSAAGGAAWGGGVGAVLPVMIGVGNRVVQGVRGAVDPDVTARATIARAIERDATTPAALEAATGEAAGVRPGLATVADVGGENVRGLVERVAQTPGAGRTLVVPRLEGRQAGQLARLGQDLREATGSAQTAMQATEQTMQQRAVAARPLYERAMAADVAADPNLSRIWQEVTADGWGLHILKRPELRRTLETEFGISQPRSTLSMPVLDAWKRQADDLVEAARRSGENNRARVISGLRDRLVAAVDEANPAYAEARNAWAGPSRYLDAIEQGRGISGTKIGAEELRATLAGMTDAEREGFRIGAVSSILGRMGNDPAKLGDMTKFLRSPEMRAKLDAIMPSTEAADQWRKAFDFEVRSSELTGQALRGSATARRLAEDAQGKAITGDLVMDALGSTLTGHWWSTLMRGAAYAPRALRDTVRSRSDRIIAEQLTDPANTNRLMEFLGPRRGAAYRVPQNALARTVLGTNAPLIADQH